MQGDVSKEADVIRLFEETKTAFGTLDILVNNAAFQGYTPIEQVTAEAFHQHFNVNVLGAILAIQSSLKLFSDKGGNIINISSGASKMPLPTASSPLGRRGLPEDIAKATVFLASDDAAWITGEQISVSGGMLVFKFRSLLPEAGILCCFNFLQQRAVKLGMATNLTNIIHIKNC